MSAKKVNVQAETPESQEELRRKVVNYLNGAGDEESAYRAFRALRRFKLPRARRTV